MTAIEFCERYLELIEAIEDVVKPEYMPAINELRETDPQDLITPESRFGSQSSAIGFLFCMMVTIRKRGVANGS